MSNINKEIAIILVFLILVTFWGILKTPVDTKIQVNNEHKVGGMHIRFEEGVSESEVKAILKNYNMTTNYSIRYNIDTTVNKYYIILDKDNWDVRHEISKGMKKENKDWIKSSPAQVVRKGDDYIFTISEQAIHDENFLAILDKYDIQVKKFVWCDVNFEKSDGSKDWIPEEYAIRIKNELENNERIFSVSIVYV
ncbi:MAG TPA: UPF0228 family protein [Methanosarcina sp.]|nr:UPF0228 family protein [Methanosarcina sp.]